MQVIEKIKPNIKQQECIDNINGKYLVLAGPGTGKTFTIIQRIKSMIERGIEPSKILCLTFTDAAANEMKIRLEKELDKLSVDVNIYTYHSFCCNIIDEYPEEFELSHSYRIMNDAVSRAFIKECIDEINPKEFRTEKNDPYYYIDTIKRRIEEIKKHRLNKEQYFKNIETNPDWAPELFRLKDELEAKLKKGEKRVVTLAGKIEAQGKKIEQARELWTFYERYQAKMEQNHYLDYNDMINCVLNKFESSPAFLDQVANKYKYLLVDEYQDTNQSQNSIVFNFTHALKSKNVFVVGDDDQIIYTFQGARIDTIEKFLEEFPDTKVICLEENMRSTQNILDVARMVTKQDTRRLEDNPKFSGYHISKNLAAKNEKLFDKNSRVRCYKYADIMQEYTEIVNEIEKLIKSGNCPTDDENNKKLSEIAILTRTNGELDTFAELLKARNIPYELKDGKNIFTIKGVNILYYYMQMLVNPELHSYRIFQLLLAQPFGINPKDYQKLYDNISKEKTFIDVIRTIPEEEFLEPEKIKEFINTYDYLSIYKTKENIKNTVLEIGARTGIFNYYLNTDINQAENILGLKRFVDEAVNYSEIYRTGCLEEFVEYLKILIEDEINILTEKAPVAMNAIQLCTYHSAKGREFEYVYMPTLNEHKWEKDRGSLKSEIPVDKAEYKTEDELKEMKLSDRIKVMYVGMTRAKHTLRLSYVSAINGKGENLSKFIYNIQDVFETEAKSFDYTEQTFYYVAKQALIKRDYDYRKDFCALVDAKLADRAFSPSAFNTYLKCPRQYLYNNILEFNGKDSNPDNMNYGTAVHSACEYLINFAKEKGEYPSKENFIKEFRRKLATLPLSSYNQRANLEIRGEKTLGEYYHQITSTPISWLYEAEKHLFFELDGIKFHGIIDRIDKNEDETFTIYDYKTGNAKKGVVPDGEHEDYYNQMALYKYFFEKSEGVKVSKTTFIYPENYTKNLELELCKADCEEVVDKFKNAISSIREYNFEPSHNKDVCKWCCYKDFCEMGIV